MGYQGEIRLGKPGRKEFDKNGNPIHFVDSETFSNIKKQIGISEKVVKDNSLIEGINGQKKRLILMVISQIFILNNKEKLNDN